TAAARDLAIATARLASVDGTAEYRARRWRFHVGAAATATAPPALVVDGELARDGAAPLALAVDARGLDVALLGALSPELADVGGTLEAHVRVGGTRAAPRPSGWLHLTDGRVGLRDDR